MILKKIALSLLVFLLLLPALVLAAGEDINTKKGLGIQGYDPVAYFDTGAVKGNKKITYEFQSVTYRFNSDANKTKFIESPEQYLPQYGGFCAYAMLEGDKVNIDPESFKIVDEKLYLYYDGLFGDTLEKWNNLVVDQTESSLISKADSNWQDLKE